MIDFGGGDDSPERYYSERSGALEEQLTKAIELLEQARGTVRTHAMQTYNKLSGRLADEIDAFLKEHGK